MFHANLRAPIASRTGARLWLTAASFLSTLRNRHFEKTFDVDIGGRALGDLWSTSGRELEGSRARDEENMAATKRRDTLPGTPDSIRGKRPPPPHGQEMTTSFDATKKAPSSEVDHEKAPDSRSERPTVPVPAHAHTRTSGAVLPGPPGLPRAHRALMAARPDPRREED